MCESYSIEGVDYYLLRDISKEWFPLSMNPSNVPVKRKLATLNIPVETKLIPIKTRTGNTKTFNCEVVKASLVNTLEDFNRDKPVQDEAEQLLETALCYFYIIQKYPDHAPQIIKMGKTTRTPEERSREFYVYSPKILFTAPISPVNEKTLIQMITVGAVQLGDEEFWITDVAGMVDRARAIVAYLPT